jgi:hypothetical protein
LSCPVPLDPPEITRLAPPAPTPKKRRKQIEGQAEMIFPIDNPQPSEFAEKPSKRLRRQIREVDIEVVRPQSTSRERK